MITPKTSPLLPLILVVFGLSFVSCGESKPPRGLLVSDRSELSLGVVDWGATIKETIVLKNAGSGPLHIHSATTSCGCARVLQFPEAIAAGEEAVLTLEFRMQLLPGAWRAPLLIAHDGEGETLRIPMQARLLPAWRHRGAPSFPSLKGGQASVGLLRLRTVHETAPRVVESRSSDSRLRLGDVRTVPETPEAFDLDYFLTPSLQPGYYRHRITLLCQPGDPHERLDIPLSYWVEGPVDAQPRRLAFPAEDEGEREVLVIAKPGAELTFVTATASGASVSVGRIEERGESFVVHLRAQAPLAPATLRLSFERNGRPETLAVGLSSRDEVLKR